MDTVFPVEIAWDGEDGSRNLFQAFTRDVSEGGMCLELKRLGSETDRIAVEPYPRLSLTINTPFSAPIRAHARIVWLKKQEAPYPVRYIFGVAYTDIAPVFQKRLIRYATRLQWIPRVASVIGILIVASLLVLFYQQQRLIQDNKKLIYRLVDAADRQSRLMSGLNRIESKKSRLSRALAGNEKKIRRYEAKIESLQDQTVAQSRLKQDLERSLARERELKAELRDLELGRQKMKVHVNSVRKEEAYTHLAVLTQMCDWISSHQNMRTGLVSSFEGDASLQDKAFTYDQALAALVFLVNGLPDRASAVLSFFAERRETPFFNAYDAAFKSPSESEIRTGPSIWIGIAAVQYEARFHSGRYIGLARRIGDWVIRFQDSEGGLPGGPRDKWYSTEHNLDAYAFFTMLHEMTQDPRFAQAAEKSFAWIKKYAFSQQGGMNRGKGDATIATDTFSWAIAGIGPEKLLAAGFDPDEIIDYAEKACAVTVMVRLPDGTSTKASGFDFGKSAHIGRGAVISTEWTAQMIVTYQALARYYLEQGQTPKYERYRQKADFYLAELQKLAITSPSRTGQGRGCLPYATMDNVDTGHGWRTPKGQRTGSVAGTAYGIFAWKRFNPLQIDSKRKN